MLYHPREQLVLLPSAHRSPWSSSEDEEWLEQELARGARCPGEVMEARPPVGKGHLSLAAVTVTLAFREAYRIRPVSCRPRAVSLSLPLKTDSASDWHVRPLRLEEKGQ